MGVAITVASQKGGVGKTTTVVNLAGSLCLAGKKVLLLDLDPQGNASSGVGFHRSPNPTAPGKGNSAGHAFLTRVVTGKGIEPVIQQTSIENLALIPSSPELSELEIIKRIQDSAVQKFRKQIRTLSREYDYILIDCPPSLGGLPTIALSMSDAVLVPVQCEYYAMEGLSQILPVIRELQRTTNTGLKILGFLLTMYSDELQLANDVVEEVTGYFKELVFHTIIPRDVVLAEAASHGVPAFHYEATSRGAWSYIELAKEILNHDKS